MNKIMMERQYREVLGWCQVKGLCHTPSIKGIGLGRSRIHLSLSKGYMCHWLLFFQILGGGFERKLLLIVQISILPTSITLLISQGHIISQVAKALVSQ